MKHVRLSAAILGCCVCHLKLVTTPNELVLILPAFSSSADVLVACVAQQCGRAAGSEVEDDSTQGAARAQALEAALQAVQTEFKQAS